MSQCKDCKPTVPPFVNWDDAPVTLCPLHAAVPEMVKLLQEMDERGDWPMYRGAKGWIDQARVLLAFAKVKGQ